MTTLAVTEVLAVFVFLSCKVFLSPQCSPAEACRDAQPPRDSSLVPLSRPVLSRSWLSPSSAVLSLNSKPSSALFTKMQQRGGKWRNRASLRQNVGAELHSFDDSSPWVAPTRPPSPGKAAEACAPDDTAGSSTFSLAVAVRGPGSRRFFSCPHWPSFFWVPVC